MFLEDIGIKKTKPTGGLAEAMAYSTVTNLSVICIPADYLGSDSVPDPTGVVIWDLRSPFNANWQDQGPAILARVARTGVAANVSATPFTTLTPPVGTYRASIYIVNTTAFTTAGVSVSIGYTDAKQAQTQVTAATATPAGSIVQAELVFESSGAAQITYAVNSTGTYGACSVFIVLERLA
jgi:hypothetical protein